MICSYLLHTGHSENTKDALRFYGDARTQNNKVCFTVYFLKIYLNSLPSDAIWNSHTINLENK